MIKELFSHLIVSFFKGSFRKPAEPALLRAESGHGKQPYFNSSTSRGKQPYFNSEASHEASAGVQYRSITNVFKAAGEAKLETPKSKEGRKDYLVPILEDEDKKMKHDAMEIINDFYGVTTDVDIWLALQRFDAFIQSRKRAENEKAGHSSNSQKTFKREVSKYPFQSGLRRRIIECIQESQASTADLWSDALMLLAVSVLRWDLPELAELLQGKKVFDEKKILPTTLSIHKLFRFERQVGEGCGLCCG